MISLAFVWVALVLLLAGLLMWLWNLTLPQVFGLRKLDYWQSFRLLLIAGILFGTFHYQLPLQGGTFNLP